jgi:hypothetical protein
LAKAIHCAIIFISLLYSWIKIKKSNIKIWRFFLLFSPPLPPPPPSFLVRVNPPKSLQIWILNFKFWPKIFLKRKVAWHLHPAVYNWEDTGRLTLDLSLHAIIYCSTFTIWASSWWMLFLFLKILNFTSVVKLTISSNSYSSGGEKRISSNFALLKHTTPISKL